MSSCVLHLSMLHDGDTDVCIFVDAADLYCATELRRKVHLSHVDFHVA